MADIDCAWCTETHGESWLCPEARRVLDQLRKQVMEGASRYDLPTLEFGNDAGGVVEGILCKALAVHGFYTDTLSIYRPGIAITPILMDETTIKPLVLVDDDTALRRIGRLLDQTATSAIRQARKARDEAFRHRSV